MLKLKSITLTTGISLSGWLVCSGFIGLLSVNYLVTEGLLGDGLCYAAISRNMAVGQGTFWRPFYSTSYWLPYNPELRAFYEHPPLMFGIQSYFFRWFGDTLWTEKIYSITVLLLTILLIAQLWKLSLPENSPLRSYAWAPVMIWYSFSIVHWASLQNLLDSTLSLFCLLAILLVLRGMQQPYSGRSWLLGTGAVLSIMAAFLTKGPVSLHVLGFPVLYGVLFSSFRLFRRNAVWVLGLGVGFSLLFILLLLYEPAQHNLSMYIQQQIWASVTNKRELTGRFVLIEFLIRDILLITVVLLGVYGVGCLLKLYPAKEESSIRVGVFWVCVGLSVVCPMLISKKQYVHYLLPALPYLALGLANWLLSALLPIVRQFEHLPFYRGSMITGGFLLWAITLVNANNRVGDFVKDHRVLLTDIHTIGRTVPRQSLLGVFPDLMIQFPLHPYLQRYYQIDMATFKSLPPYAMLAMAAPKGQADSLLSIGYSPISVTLNQFRLYKRASIE